MLSYPCCYATNRSGPAYGTLLENTTLQVGRHRHVDLLRPGQVQSCHDRFKLVPGLGKPRVQAFFFADGRARPALVVVGGIHQTVGGQLAQQAVVHGGVQLIR
jgi:hypothetical protein